MKTYKVVVTDFEYEHLVPERTVLESNGIQLVECQCITEDDVIEAARDADGIINQYAPLTRRVIEQLTDCKVISRYGIGVDTIDLEAATEKGIVVANVNDYCIDEVADHAFALLLSHARKTAVLNHFVKQGIWDYKLGSPINRLRGRTLGLVGFGKIPQNMAPKANAFGLEVIAYDPFVNPDAAHSLQVEMVELDELCRRADYISVHLPLNEATRGSITTKHFQMMKSDAVIINTARGPVIDEQALFQAIRTKQIGGAALDVIQNEPISPDHPFLTMNEVLLNPHVAWYSEQSQLELKTKAAQNVADVLDGFYPRYLVNPLVKDKIKLIER